MIVFFLIHIFSHWQVQQLKKLAKEISDEISPLKSMHLPPINRGADVNTYYPTEDGLLIQYDFDRYLRNYCHESKEQSVSENLYIW